MTNSHLVWVTEPLGEGEGVLCGGRRQPHKRGTCGPAPPRSEARWCPSCGGGRPRSKVDGNDNTGEMRFLRVLRNGTRGT